MTAGRSATVNRTLALIEQAMARAVAAQRPAMAANFTHPAWRMTADEFLAFWGGTRMASVATAGERSPHAAPLEVSLVDGEFVAPSFADSVRVRDIGRNPNVVITAWDDAAIVYGRARAPDGGPGMVRVTVHPTRIYAIRAPAGHPAHRPL